MPVLTKASLCRSSIRRSITLCCGANVSELQLEYPPGSGVERCCCSRRSGFKFRCGIANHRRYLVERSPRVLRACCFDARQSMDAWFMLPCGLPWAPRCFDAVSRLRAPDCCHTQRLLQASSAECNRTRSPTWGHVEITTRLMAARSPSVMYPLTVDGM